MTAASHTHIQLIVDRRCHDVDAFVAIRDTIAVVSEGLVSLFVAAGAKSPPVALSVYALDRRGIALLGASCPLVLAADLGAKDVRAVFDDLRGVRPDPLHRGDHLDQGHVMPDLLSISTGRVPARAWAASAPGSDNRSRATGGASDRQAGDEAQELIFITSVFGVSDLCHSVHTVSSFTVSQAQYTALKSIHLDVSAMTMTATHLSPSVRCVRCPLSVVACRTVMQMALAPPLRLAPHTPVLLHLDNDLVLAGSAQPTHLWPLAAVPDGASPPLTSGGGCECSAAPCSGARSSLHVTEVNLRLERVILDAVQRVCDGDLWGDLWVFRPDALGPLGGSRCAGSVGHDDVFALLAAALPPQSAMIMSAFGPLHGHERTCSWCWVRRCRENCLPGAYPADEYVAYVDDERGQLLLRAVIPEPLRRSSVLAPGLLNQSRSGRRKERDGDDASRQAIAQKIQHRLARLASSANAVPP